MTMIAYAAATTSFVLFFGFPTVLLAAEAAPAGIPAAPAGEATYVGDETCKACHAPQFQKFAKTLMGKIFLFNPRDALEKRGCESCHGPGSKHVAAGGGKGVGGMVTFRKGTDETAEVQNAACIQCHGRGPQTYWGSSAHASRGLSCVSCHTVMEKTSDRFQLAKVGDKTVFYNKRAQIEVCAECHPDKHARLFRSSHMPLREGKMTCTDCHNPHGTPNPSMLIQNTINDNCYTCHAERRGPFLWEHPPVMESCTNCHDPHGSVNVSLLKIRVPRLCTTCHIATRHPGTPNPSTSVFVFNRSCTNCHSQVHGSNHPSGVRFTR